MNDYIRPLINALENASIKAKWFDQEPDSYYIDECEDWIMVALNYAREIQAKEITK